MVKPVAARRISPEGTVEAAQRGGRGRQGAGQPSAGPGVPPPHAARHTTTALRATPATDARPDRQIGARNLEGAQG